MSLVKKSDELRRVIEACRGYFVTAGVFSLAINLLYLAAPLYMLQVYDRVISSSSEVTLVMLTFALIMALLALAGLDAVRARVLTRASIRLDRLLAGRIMSAIIEGAQNLGGARNQLLVISIPSVNLSPGRVSTPFSICPGHRSISQSFSCCTHCLAGLHLDLRSC